MADRKKGETNSVKRAVYEILPFEKQIVDLESKIVELEEMSKDTSLDLNGEIKGLKSQLGKRIAEVFHQLSPWQKVQVARAKGRPLTSHYIEHMCEDWIELHGDRQFRDDHAIVTGLARIGGVRCLLVAHRKGSNLEERIASNFGSAHPEGYRKALRKMRMAEKFGLPIVCLINTPGAYPGIGAEERGQAWAIAENLEAMFELRVPIVCLVIGEGGSGGALGIGIGDRVLMLEHSYYSVISPEGCAAILWRDRERADEAAAALKLSAADLLELGIIDEVIDEPVGAAHRDSAATIKLVQERIVGHLKHLMTVDKDDLIDQRYEKFRRMGTLFGDADTILEAENAAAAAAEEGKASKDANQSSNGKSKSKGEADSAGK